MLPGEMARGASIGMALPCGNIRVTLSAQRWGRKPMQALQLRQLRKTYATGVEALTLSKISARQG